MENKSKLLTFALRWKIPQILLLCMGFLFFVFLKGPPTCGDKYWEGSLIYNTHNRIHGSAHLAHTLNYVILRFCQKVFNEPYGAELTLRTTSYLLSLVYLAVLLLFSSQLDSFKRECAFIISGILAPLAIFFHGYKEVGFYSYPFLLLILGLYLSRKAVLKYPYLISLLGGLAAALHGVGLFFLPGIILINFSLLPPSVSRRDKVQNVVETIFLFFGAYGIFFLLYIMESMTVVSGDANTVKREIGYFASLPLILNYLFQNMKHVIISLILGAPSFFVLISSIFLKKKKKLDLKFPSVPWQACFFAGMGIIFMMVFHGCGLAFDMDIYIPAMSLISILSTFIIFGVKGEKKLVRLCILITLTLNVTASACIYMKLVDYDTATAKMELARMNMRNSAKAELLENNLKLAISGAIKKAKEKNKLTRLDISKMLGIKTSQVIVLENLKVEEKQKDPEGEKLIRKLEELQMSW